MSDKTLELPRRVDDTWLHAPELFSGSVVIYPETGITDMHLIALQAGKSAVVANQMPLLSKTAQVKIEPQKTVERARSAHEVGFGALVCRATLLPKGKRPEQAIALKPFVRAEKALHEVNCYRVLAELGVETFEPIGVFPAKKGNHYVAITKKRNNLTSLDRDKWIISRKVIDEASAEIAQRNNDTVMGISQLLAYIHLKGIYHPDGQIKNYAKTPKGVIGIIDTENLIVSHQKDPNALEYAWHDIEKLVKSLIISTQDKENVDVFGVGMLYGMNLDGLRNSIEELIIDPYLDSLSKSINSASEAEIAHINVLYEGIYNRFFSSQRWPSYIMRASHASKSTAKILN